jgi:hypothetical protein
MITLTIKKTKLKSGEVIEARNIEMPCLWEEVTLKQFLALTTTEDMTPLKLLAILTDLSEDYLSQIPSKSINVASNYAFFMREPDAFKRWKKPDQVTIAGKRVRVPALREETFAQKIYIQQEVNRVIEETKSTYDAIPFALAVYFYPLVTGDKKEFSERKIKDFIPDVLNMRAVEAVPTADFFLTSFVKSFPRKQTRSLLSLLRKKQTQALRIWKSTALSTRLTRSHAEMF